MGDFELARVCRRQREIAIQTRISSLYVGAGIGDFKGCRAARSIGKRAVPQARLVAMLIAGPQIDPKCYTAMPGRHSGMRRQQ